MVGGEEERGRGGVWGEERGRDVAGRQVRVGGVEWDSKEGGGRLMLRS